MKVCLIIGSHKWLRLATRIFQEQYESLAKPVGKYKGKIHKEFANKELNGGYIQTLIAMLMYK